MVDAKHLTVLQRFLLPLKVCEVIHLDVSLPSSTTLAWDCIGLAQKSCSFCFAVYQAGPKTCKQEGRALQNQLRSDVKNIGKQLWEAIAWPKHPYNARCSLESKEILPSCAILVKTALLDEPHGLPTLPVCFFWLWQLAHTHRSFLASQKINWEHFIGGIAGTTILPRFHVPFLSNQQPFYLDSSTSNWSMSFASREFTLKEELTDSKLSNPGNHTTLFYELKYYRMMDCLKFLEQAKDIIYQIDQTFSYWSQTSRTRV